jgi:hypothetical protein
MGNYSDILLYLLALLIILAMLSLITGILISALRIIVPFIVMVGGFWLALWANERMNKSLTPQD